MRMRPKKHREERISAVEDYFAHFSDEKLDPDATFENRNPRTVYEFGCGKGAFCTQLALREPQTDIIAIEKVRDVVLMAMEKAASHGLSNLRFANFDLERVAEILPPRSADAIYINFCDPWPRKRHAKRRLTSPLFLERYKGILKEGARIYFKTDNALLFDYSLGTFAEAGYTLYNVCRDLHADPLGENNIETEYEKNFSAKGFKINYLEASL